MNLTYQCPKCEEWIEILPTTHTAAFDCPWCNEPLRMLKHAKSNDMPSSYPTAWSKLCHHHPRKRSIEQKYPKLFPAQHKPNPTPPQGSP